MGFDSDVAVTVTPTHNDKDDDGSRVVERIPSSVLFANPDRESIVSDVGDESYSSFESFDEMTIPDFESSAGVGLSRHHLSIESLTGYLEECEQKQRRLSNTECGSRRGMEAGAGPLRRRCGSIQKNLGQIPSNTDAASRRLEAKSDHLRRRSGTMYQKQQNQISGLNNRSLSVNSRNKSSCRWDSSGMLTQFDGNKSFDSIPQLPKHIDSPNKNNMRNSTWGDTIAGPTNAANLSQFLNFSPRKQGTINGTTETNATTPGKAIMMSPMIGLHRSPTKNMHDGLQKLNSLKNSMSITSLYDSSPSELDSVLVPRKPRRLQSKIIR